jgi:hypothetical protein
MKDLMKPALIGALWYLPLYAGLMLIYQVPELWLKNQWLQLLLTPYNLIMLPACGYIAASILKSKGLIVGAMTGTLVAVVTVVVSASVLGEAWYGSSLIATTFGFILKYGFYSALGGGIGQLHATSTSSQHFVSR